MSYTPTKWKTGDVITAENLNNMEGGIKNAQLYIVNITQSGGAFTADKTFTEIQTAYLDGMYVIFRITSEGPNGAVSTSDLPASGILVDTVITSETQISMTLEASNLYIMNMTISMVSSGSVSVVRTAYSVPNSSVVPQ